MQDKKVTAFIEPPKKIPLFLKIGIYISNKVTKKDLQYYNIDLFICIFLT